MDENNGMPQRLKVTADAQVIPAAQVKAETAAITQDWDEEAGGYVCSASYGPAGELLLHTPTVMEQDWMYGDVYRCGLCGRVIEVGDDS